MLLGRIRTDLSPAPTDAPRPSPRASLVEGFRFVARRPFFRVLLVWSASVNLLINAVFFMAVLRLMEAGVPAVQIGLVETAIGIGGLLGAVAAPWIIDRFRTGTLTVLIAWSFVPLAVPMVFWNNPLVVSLAIGAGLFLNPAGNAGIGAYRMALTPPDLQGRVQSTSQFVSMSVMPLAPVLAGVLLATLGGPSAVVVLGVLIAGIALVPTLSHSVRSVPRPAVWQAELAEAAVLSSPEAPRRQLFPAGERRGVDEGAEVGLDAVPQ